MVDDKNKEILFTAAEQYGAKLKAAMKALADDALKAQETKTAAGTAFQNVILVAMNDIAADATKKGHVFGVSRDANSSHAPLSVTLTVQKVGGVLAEGSPSLTFRFDDPSRKIVVARGTTRGEVLASFDPDEITEELVWDRLTAFLRQLSQ